MANNHVVESSPDNVINDMCAEGVEVDGKAARPRKEREVHLDSYGDPGNPTIILLHGGGMGGWMWRPQIESLSGAYQLLVPDLPAHGRSSDETFTMVGAARAVAAAIREHGHQGRAHVVGLSLGAQVAVQLLADDPDVVDRAMISSALVRPYPVVGRTPAWAFRVAYRLLRPLSRYDWWVRLNMRPYGDGMATYLTDWKASLQALTPAGYAAFSRANLELRIPTELRDRTIPALVVAAEQELPIMRASARDLARALPRATGRLVRLPGSPSAAAAHAWSLTYPDLFTAALRAHLEDRPLPAFLVDFPSVPGQGGLAGSGLL